MQTGKMERKEGNFPNEVCKFLVLGGKKKRFAMKERKELQHSWSNGHCERKKCDCLIKILTVQEANESVWIRIN